MTCSSGCCASGCWRRSCRRTRPAPRVSRSPAPGWRPARSGPGWPSTRPDGSGSGGPRHLGAGRRRRAHPRAGGRGRRGRRGRRRRRRPGRRGGAGGWFADPTPTKVGHDLKPAINALTARGWPVDGVACDTALAAYLARPGQAHLRPARPGAALPAPHPGPGPQVNSEQQLSLIPDEDDDHRAGRRHQGHGEGQGDHRPGRRAGEAPGVPRPELAAGRHGAAGDDGARHHGARRHRRRRRLSRRPAVHLRRRGRDRREGGLRRDRPGGQPRLARSSCRWCCSTS